MHVYLISHVGVDDIIVESLVIFSRQGKHVLTNSPGHIHISSAAAAAASAPGAYSSAGSRETEHTKKHHRPQELDVDCLRSGRQTPGETKTNKGCVGLLV